MSLHAMHWARQSLKKMPETVKAPARLALMLLADYADEQHASWPSINTMALEMGCSVRSVQRAIDLLEMHGLVKVESRQARNGRQMSNRYFLAVEGLFAGCQYDTPTMSTQNGEGDKLTPSEGDNLTGEGDTGDRGRVSPVSPLDSTNMTQPLNPSLSDASAANVFEQAAQAADDGTPPPARQRRYPMTLDWQPDSEQLAAACLRVGIAADTQPAPYQVAKFVAHHADFPERQHGAGNWHIKLADWLRNDRNAQTAHPTPGGADHAQRPGTHSAGAQRSERDAIRQELADPYDTSWADGWWPDGEQGSGAGAGDADLHAAGGDFSEDVFECVRDEQSAQAQQAGAGHGVGALAATADPAHAGTGDQRHQAHGQYLAADDSGACQPVTPLRNGRGHAQRG